MAMTLDETFNLRASGGWLRNRTICAIGSYATYLAGLGDGATADQKAFVARVMPGNNAEIEADHILWWLVFNGDVQASGQSISDATLKAQVEYGLQSLGRVKAV